MLGVKTIWTDDEIEFIISNFHQMDNRSLATALGKTLTVTRSKAYELGLKRMELEFWDKEQIQFLVDNYKTIGDTELAEMFEERFPKNKTWTKKHIEKKRKYLKLKRNRDEILAIKRRNFDAGKTNTIYQNSGSIALSDKYIASLLTVRKPELRASLLENKELINLQRTIYQANRLCKTNSKQQQTETP